MDFGYQVDGQKMLEARLRKGIGQKEMADYLQVHPVTVWRWEKGHMTPSPRLLRLYSNMVGKPIATFQILRSENGSTPSGS